MTTTKTAASFDLKYTSIDELCLDPQNPRLGRVNTERDLTQDQVMSLMRDWSLDELAVSFLESGFWPHEALIVVREPINRTVRLVVVEGNRRLAALKMIQRTRSGEERSKKWRDLIKSYGKDAFVRLDQVPYVLEESRDAVASFLGYRHVTGIKEWNPAEKAQFIAYLIEQENLTYEQVRRRIGSKLPTVRQNYISYRMLLQMDQFDDIDIERVEQRFSVLYLSLRTPGVRKFLSVDIEADLDKARQPVPRRRAKNLVNYARWLFGFGDSDPIVEDSRDVDEFGEILESPAAVEYLERGDAPSFSVARRMAGVAESEVSEHVERAADELEEALKAAHVHKSSRRLQEAVRRVGQHTVQLLGIFPTLRKELLSGDK